MQATSHDPTVSEQLSELASLHDEVIKKISGRNDAIADRIDAWVCHSLNLFSPLDNSKHGHLI